ncbi:MAG: porin [Bacteroidaceae bacterium]|nr:porin [Bacteroidaceae bacterium]
MRKKNSLLLLSFLLAASSLSAEVTTTPLPDQEPKGQGNIVEQLKQNTSFGGYVIAKVNGTTSDDAKAQADLGLRLVRLYVDTRLGDFAFKLQMQVNGNTSGVNGPRIVDAWAEWQHWKEFRVKFGQFKRCFTFENPMHPWLIGGGAYSQLTDKLAGFNDLTGEHSSNGRDFGLQFQGDLLPGGTDGHRWIHYQAGIYTGQGINFSDKNSRKDLIGGLIISPLSELQIGVFGWTGNYVNADNETIERRRYSVGLNYNKDWNLRTEFAVDNAGEKADAWYVTLGSPSFYRTRIYAHYDVLRNRKSWDGAHSQYGLSVQHSLFTNLMFQANYAFHVNKNAADTRYHTADIQVYWRF